MLRPMGSPWLRRLAPIAAICLVAFGCAPAPSTVTTAAPMPGPAALPSAPIATALPLGSPLPAIPLADHLRDSLDVEGILADLDRLQAITLDHGGIRPAGSEGYTAAAQFVADELRTAGYDVRLQPVDLPVFTQSGPSTLEITGAGGRTFDDLHDFKAMLFSPSAEITAPLHALGYNPHAVAGDTGGLGCNPEDWLAVPAGVVVLVQPGNCRRHDAVVLAQAAGVVGLITAYPGWSRDGVLRPTLIEPSDIRIPVLGADMAVGNALNDAAATGASVHISVHASTAMGSSVNVIGETPWGDPGHVVMLGGHLDSVVDGPGMNDDGSGTMTVLGIAKALASLGRAAAGPGGAPPGAAWKVRVGFWTGEEIGLWGSRAYVASLPPGAVAAYLNLDMLGSPNGVRLVYDGATTPRPQESLVIGGLVSRALDDMGLVWQTASLGGSSDHASFENAGIPTGGLFAGANEIKTQAEADLFGGTANAPADPCMHLACDTTNDLDPTLLGELARAAAWTVGALASREVDLSGS